MLGEYEYFVSYIYEDQYGNNFDNIRILRSIPIKIFKDIQYIEEDIRSHFSLKRVVILTWHLLNQKQESEKSYETSVENFHGKRKKTFVKCT